ADDRRLCLQIIRPWKKRVRKDLIFFRRCALHQQAIESGQQIQGRGNEFVPIELEQAHRESPWGNSAILIAHCVGNTASSFTPSTPRLYAKQAEMCAVPAA